MNLHEHQLYEQHSESFNSWSAIVRINTNRVNHLIIKYSPVYSSILLWYSKSTISSLQLCGTCDVLKQFQANVSMLHNDLRLECDRYTSTDHSCY